jgi:FtsH-binding integral membrane protein
VSAAGYALPRAAARTPTLFGRVMGLVALTVAFATFGVWLARSWGGAGWFIAWLLSLGCIIGLNVANARGNTSLALVLLLAFGLLVGISVSATVNYYAATDSTAVRQAFGATALFVGALGAGGYAIRRDLSFLYRILFWLLLALLLAGIVLIFVHIPAVYTVWSVLGLGIFGLDTVVDFNRLRHAGQDEAIPS